MINARQLCELDKNNYMKITGTNASDYENIIINLERYFKTKQKKKELDKIKVNLKFAAYDNINKMYYLIGSENGEVLSDGNWMFESKYLICDSKINMRYNLKNDIKDKTFTHYYNDIIKIDINDFELVETNKIKCCKYVLKDSEGKVFNYAIQNEYYQKLIKPLLNYKNVTFETCTTNKVFEDAYTNNSKVLQKMIIKINNQVIGCIMPIQIR